MCKLFPKKNVGGKTAEEKLELVREYLENSVASYQGDPADSDFQRGHEACAVEMLDWFKEL